MKADELIVFRNITASHLLYDMALCTEIVPGADVTGGDFREGVSGCVHDLIEFAAAHGFTGNLFHVYLTERLVSDENAFSIACENLRGKGEGAEISPSLLDAALKDMEQIAAWYRFDFCVFGEKTGLPALSMIREYRQETEVSLIYSHRVRDAIAALSLEMAAAAEEPRRMLSLLQGFFTQWGVGALGLHKAFRVEEGEQGAGIVPVRNIRHVQLKDLVGYEDAKQALVENTEAFLQGKGANNCLLYGDAGTGKSTSIMAITNMYFPQGLRVIELYKHQAKLLHDVIDQIKNRNYRFIVYMDDLSFEDFETDYKYLKAVIEGGLEMRPENVLIYATSNRRHLVRESFRDKPDIMDDDLHRGDTVQEKLSLAYRFGRMIYFGSPSKAQFQDIVLELADRAGLTQDRDFLLSEAARFEMRHGGKSGRTAAQLVEYLKGLQ
ncbi:MAG: ATP-binding protein [Lachnospiraceae bacterium]|nr:ATP-binding protein [Lachnospiraceae bacterium]